MGMPTVTPTPAATAHRIEGVLEGGEGGRSIVIARPHHSCKSCWQAGHEAGEINKRCWYRPSCDSKRSLHAQSCHPRIAFKFVVLRDRFTNPQPLLLLSDFLI